MISLENDIIFFGFFAFDKAKTLEFAENKMFPLFNTKLSNYKITEDFKVVDNIPRTGSDKIMRYQLKIKK